MKFKEPIVERLKTRENYSGLLNEHHLNGLFYHHYQQGSGLSQYKKQWIHNQVILEELEHINLLAKKFNITATILKGAHLLLDLYTDLGSRFLSDIDILIPVNTIEQWELLLEKLGYKVLFQKTFHGNNFKQEWCKTIGEIEINIEVHTKLFFHLKKENWLLSSTHFSNLTKLSTEDLFLHLCGHLAFQHTFLKLYWVFDIYFYYKQYFKDFNWDLLKAKSKSLGLFRSVQMCLWILNEHFGEKIDIKIIRIFEIDRNMWWKKILTVDFLIEPLANKNIYFILKHATKDHLTTALRYDISWLYHYKIQKL